MKITLFLLLFVTFQAYSHATYSQSTRISIPRSELRVGEILDKIEAQTEYLFVYNKKSVDVRRTVNVDADNQPVSEVLDEIFNGTDIRYVMEGKNIVLTKQNEKASEIIAAVQQENISVKGVITDTKGEPIIGANVVEKGTTNGCITNIDGEFTLNTPTNATLVISFIGYQPVTIALNGQKTLNVQMQEEALSLETVVVTAMGIKRKSSTLTYSVQQVDGNELTRVKDPNLVNSLAGKIAGVNIQKTAGVGGSAKVSIRGARSAFESGNNQPLYVIDGVPMLSGSTQSVATALGGNNDGANMDTGDGISNLNPDDIQSMSVLKGASAAALYGSQAANGVILITTKKGHAGSTRITYSADVTFENPFIKPEFQNTYGESSGQSWGEAGKAFGHDNFSDYFSTGHTAINSFTLSTGNDKAQTYISYANTSAVGMIDNNKLSKHNFTFRETGKFFNDKVTIDGNVNLMRQKMKNPAPTGGFYLNPLVGLYRFPRGLNMADYSGANMEVYNESRNMMVQNWYGSTTDMESNPYWLKNRVNSKTTRTRVIASINANWTATDWLTLQARGTADYASNRGEQSMYASTASALCGANGRYIWSNSEEFMTYGDAMATFNKTWNKISLTAVLGGSISITKTNSASIDSGTASLITPNYFILSNINKTASAYIDQQIDARKVVQSVFATAQLGYGEALYLDLSARNDWSSTLAGTSSMDSGFFYPSVGLTWLMNKSFKMPEWISLAKVRASFAQVGNDLPMYIAYSFDHINAGGEPEISDTFAKDLKPEISDSWEIGTEWSFFNHRLDFDFTWYRTNTRNQLLRMPAKTGEEKGNVYINAGKIRNQGIEMTLGITPVMTEDFRWKTQFNLSANKNKVIELYHDPVDSKFDYTSFTYGDPGFTSMSYIMRVEEGGSLGDLYGNVFVRDENGKIKLTDAGLPERTSDNATYVGNSNPDALLGWSNSFTYRDFTLNFLIDARFGGKVFSATQADMDAYGVSKESGAARDRGYAELEGQQFKDVKSFYQTVGGQKCVTEYYMYDATNIRLREISLGYSFPQSILEKTKFIKGASLSLVARNLFFIYKDAPYDPDATMSVGNTLQGIDTYGMPTSRSIGFNVKLTF